MSVDRHYSGGRFESIASYCRAVRTGPLILVSGCAPLDENGNTLYAGDTYAQTATAIQIAMDAVAALGGSPRAVLRTRLYLAADADWKAAVQAHAERFRGIDPANTTLYVCGFIPEGVLVEIDLDAWVTDEPTEPLDAGPKCHVSVKSSEVV